MNRRHNSRNGFDWERLGLWTGWVFALGSLMFVAGSVLSLMPSLARWLALDARGVNAVFFAGSLPFTTAAWLQLAQAAHTVDPSGLALGLLRPGWRPGDRVWVSSALQFAGTLLFNLSTWDAMQTGLNWRADDLQVWVPDFAGSVLFLLSGWLAFVAIGPARRHRTLAGYSAQCNLAGCVAFMLSAITSYVPRHASDSPWAMLATVFTLLGAAGFLVGSLLQVADTRAAGPD
ncbi:MAG: hypothetical protein IAE92_10195 [Burkholderiaceae bacterium]|nr:hypothetical protein [Burkholderiaceae bacterium]